MEKQEVEMKWKLEMETGNGNWKQKWEQIMHHSLMQCFVGVRGEPVNKATCSVLCNYLFSVIKLVLLCKKCCNLVLFTCRGVCVRN